MLSGAYLCSQRLRSLSAGVRTARGLCSLMRYTRGQIERYSMPCAEILRRAPREIFLECGYCGEIPPSDFLSFFESVDIGDCECRRIFSEFVSELGWGYRAEQVKRCDDLLAELCERERYLSERLPTERKLTLALSCTALLAVLILSL